MEAAGSGLVDYLAGFELGVCRDMPAILLLWN